MITDKMWGYFSPDKTYNIGWADSHEHTIHSSHVFQKFQNFNYKNYREFVGKEKEWYYVMFDGDKPTDLIADIKKDIVEKKCKLILAYFTESHANVNQLASVHSYINSVGINLSDVIYITGCLSIDEVYNNYCQKENIPLQDRMICLGEYSTLLDRFTAVPPIQRKRFLFLNRTPTYHSIYFSYRLWNDVKSNIHISTSDKFHYAETPKKIVDETFLENSFNLFGYVEKNTDNIARFLSELPLTLDTENFSQSEVCGNDSLNIFLYYFSSDILLIRETRFIETETFITEKTWKSIEMRKPFIIIGNPNTLEKLKLFGFRTFCDWWPESYDSILNPQQRAESLLNLINGINKKSEEDLYFPKVFS